MNNDYLDYIVSVLNDRNADAFMIKYQEFIWEDWYFSDIDFSTVPHGIHWTQSVSQAYMFDNEVDALEFADDFIIPRKIEIVRIGK